MSWIWGNETTEQAQFVVSALQTELDEREGKIKALEAALKREQNDLTALLEDEVKELQARRQNVEKELQAVDALIREKQRLIQRSKNDGSKKKKKGKKSRPATPVSSPRAAEEKPAVKENGEVAALSPKAKKKTQKKKKAKEQSAASVDAEPTEDAKAVLPMDKNLKMVAKVEPNVAFIIQRSNNANTVVYAGCKTADGKSLDATTPIKVYWIMYEKDGNPTEDLNMIERNTAYGVTSKPSDVPGVYMANIASLRDRECTLHLDKHGNVLALTTINGKKGMLLRRVFVQMTTSWGIPTVDFVDIFGVDPTTFEPVYEKKKNK